MPWSNVPKELWPKMEKCVNDVMKSGKDKKSATAICYTSVVKENASRFVDQLLDEEDVDEMTTTGAIATVPMPMGSKLRQGDGDPLTPPEDLPANSSDPDPAFKRDV